MPGFEKVKDWRKESFAEGPPYLQGFAKFDSSFPHGIYDHLNRVQAGKAWRQENAKHPVFFDSLWTPNEGPYVTRKGVTLNLDIYYERDVQAHILARREIDDHLRFEIMDFGPNHADDPEDPMYEKTRKHDHCLRVINDSLAWRYAKIRQKLEDDYENSATFAERMKNPFFKGLLGANKK